jgi:protoporphyrinogen oxidase
MSAALSLRNHGVDTVILERESRAGGLVVTDEEQGYRFDRTGHLLHLRDEARRTRTLALLDEPPLRFVRRSVIYSEGVYTKYPYQSNTLGLPAQSAYECLLDFVRANARQPKPEPKNFEDYCRIHFGNAIADRFMLPYNGRLWGVHPSEVTTEWCDRFVPRPELEDVLAGAVGLKSRELGYNAEGFYPSRGIGELTAAMQRRLPNLLCSAAVLHIDPKARRCDYVDGSAEYQTLISTLPLPSLLALIEGVPQTISEAASRLRASSLYYLDVALNAPPKHDFHWTYVPESRFDFYRVGNYTAFSPQMAPPGKASLYVELCTRRPPSVERLWPSVFKQLLELGLVASADDVAFYRLRYLPFAYVIYDEPRRLALETIHDYLESLGIVTAGRYGGWNYSSMEDALHFGERAAQKSQDWLI